MKPLYKKTKKELKSLYQSFDTSRIHIAEVMDTRNVTHNGAIKIWIVNSPYPKTESDKWLTAYYSTPFAGSTPDNSESYDFEDTKKSYGMWFTPPDVGNHVLVCFVNGRNDNVDLYYFSCIHDHYMNHMLPGISKDLNSNDLSPKTEYNKAISNDESKKANYTPLYNSLLKQGLIEDDVRGAGKSSARREAPSRVYGWLTPRGTHIVMDDGEDDTVIPDWEDEPNPNMLSNKANNPSNKLNKRKGEGIRLRTRSGTQILLSEEEGNIYIINKDGSVWFELNNEGYFDLYSYNDISIRSNNNINFYADKNINIEAGNDINVKSKNNINLEIGNDYNSIIENDNKSIIKNDNDILIKNDDKKKVENNQHLTVDNTTKHFYKYYDFNSSDISTFNYIGDCYKNYGNDMYQAYLNGGIRPYYVRYTYSAIEPCVPTYYPPTEATTVPRCGSKDLEDFIKQITPPTDVDNAQNINKNTKLDKINFMNNDWSDITTTTIVNRLPQHEPWQDHIISSSGYKNHVLEGDSTIKGLKLKKNATTTKMSKPLTIVGSPVIGMPSGVYSGKEYKKDIPLYEYKQAPSGLLNPSNNYTTSVNGIEFIKQKEGFSATPYVDATGYSIGYGHFITKNEKFTTITKDEATALLTVDLKIYESCVKNYVSVNITQNQFDSLVSFIYNVGGSAFKNSTLLKVLNAGNYEAVPEQFMRWKYAIINGNKTVVNALLVRRTEEANMFSTFDENLLT